MATRKTSSKRKTGGSTRRTSSGRSGSSGRRPSSRTIDYNENGLTDEIILFIFAAVCIVMLLSNFGLIGEVGAFLSGIQFGLFGILAYVFPVLIVGGAFFLYANIANMTARIRTAAGVLMYLNCCMMSHLFIIKEESAFDGSIYKYCSETHKGGGVIGGFLAHLFVKSMGMSGTWILAILLFLVCFILLTGVSVLSAARDGGRRVSDSARRGYERSLERYEERERYREAAEAKREEEASRKRMEMKAAPGVSLDTQLVQKTDAEDFHEIVMDQGEAEKAASEKAASEHTLAALEPEEIIKESPVAEAADKNTGAMSPIAISVYGDKAESQTEPETETEAEPEPEKEPVAAVSFDMDNLSEEEFDYDSFGKELSERLSQKRMSQMTEDVVPEPTPVVFIPKGVAKPEVADVSPVSIEDMPVHTEPAPLPKTIVAPAKPRAEVPTDEITKQVKKSTKKKNWRLPKANDENLLQKIDSANTDSKDYLAQTAETLRQTLESFGINVEMTEVSQGPTVTRYEMKPEIGVKVSKIVALSDDLQLALASKDIRIEAPVPGKSAVGIEVPNAKTTMVGIREMLTSRDYRDFKGKIAFAVGKGLSGESVVADIAKMPHLLIAGTTGSGKSVCMNTLILSMLFKYTPDDVRMIMVDPKVVELSIYNGIPHLLIPVVSDPKQAAAALHWGVVEMDRRYEQFATAMVRDIKGYNDYVEDCNKRNPDSTLQKMPQIVIIVDELADLMMTAAKEVEDSIVRIAQKARACGIHLVIATQRPSVNVITGLIKANIPSRIAFAVSSGVDSRTILDSVGAEKLLGHGDMLFYPQGYSKPVRLQGPFVDDPEVRAVVEFWKAQNDGEADTDNSIISSQILESSDSGSPGAGGSGNSSTDEHTVDAARLIVTSNKASVGMLQRKFRIGFNRASRIMDELAELGVVSEGDTTKPRKILLSEEELENMIEQGYL